MKGLKQAEKNARAMGEYNAAIDANNMIGEQNQIRYEERAAEAEKNTVLAQAQQERVELSKKLRAEQAKSRVLRPSVFQSNNLDVFAAEEKYSFDQLARFDFETSQKTRQANVIAADKSRQLAYSYDKGMATRAMTLRNAEAQARKFKNERNKVAFEGITGLAKGAVQTYGVGKDAGYFN